MFKSVGLLVLLVLPSLFALSVSADYLGAPCIGTLCDNGMQCLQLDKSECPIIPHDGDASQLQLPDTCTCGGIGGDADPHYNGFGGQSFFFNAAPNTTYNLFTEENHYVNAYFVDTHRPQEQDIVAMMNGASSSSFVFAVSFVYMDMKVLCVADHKGRIRVNFNDREVTDCGADSTFYTQLEMSDTMSLEFSAFPGKEDEVSIETELLVLKLTGKRQHTDVYGNKLRGHIDIQMELKTEVDDTELHGVLGQTVSNNTAFTEESFPGEGLPEDYKVSGMFETDFGFNLHTFNASGNEPPSTDMGFVSVIRECRTQPSFVSHASRRLLMVDEPQPLAKPQNQSGMEDRLGARVAVRKDKDVIVMAQK